jgi:hypothetical protein
MTGDQQEIVKDLLDLEEGLTAWEIEFLDNLYAAYFDRDLSERQEEILDRIAKKLRGESNDQV